MWGSYNRFVCGDSGLLGGWWVWYIATCSNSNTFFTGNYSDVPHNNMSAVVKHALVQNCELYLFSLETVNTELCTVPHQSGHILNTELCTVPNQSGHILNTELCTVPNQSGHILNTELCTLPNQSGHILNTELCTVPHQSGHILPTNIEPLCSLQLFVEKVRCQQSAYHD